RVVDRLERVCGHEEQPVLRAQQRAVLSALDDDGPGSHRRDGPRGADQVRLAGELARLAVVDRHDVDLGQHAPERVALALDPEVHRVQRDQPRSLLHLAQHVQLELGIDVGQEDEVRSPKALAEDRPELCEYVQLGLEGLRLVEVVPVFAGPPERAALRGLEPGDVHAAVLEELQMRLGEVLPYRRHDVHGGEEARRVREISRGAAERLLHLAERRLDAVERDRADDEELTHYNGVLESGLDRGWPAAGARRLRSRGMRLRWRGTRFRPRGTRVPPRGKYGSSSSPSFFLVAG